MRKHHPLYFIALVPPEPLKGKLKLLKKSFGERFNCKAALKSPPHITLHMPFRFPEEKEVQLIEQLQVVSRRDIFTIQLNNFGSFEPRVVYINVDATEQLTLLFNNVQKTMKRLNVFNADYKNKGFHPHLTIAFRDLKKSIFPIAWDEYQFKQCSEQFDADCFVLLKHNGKHWDEYRTISFNNN
ncbi:MAG: 2'-5' RNA ligase family protein [Cyclobacteriaceae bacterium]|nr:2'-5' RNA ligase family protein [Cyclobacteriaceae bacterium]